MGKVHLDRLQKKYKNVQVSGDFYGALDNKVEGLLNKAAKRTGSNKRKTLKPYDL